MNAAAFSPIMIVAALVLPLTGVGIIEASATRRPCRPWIRSRASTIDHVPGLRVGTHSAGSDAVKDGGGIGANVGVHLVAGVHGTTRQMLFGDQALQGRLFGKSPAHFQRPDQHLPVMAVGEVSRRDARRNGRVGGRNPDGAAAAWM